MAQDAMQGYLQRPAHYANIDGTGEMSVGGMYLCLALLGYIESLLPPKNPRHGPMSLLILYAYMGSFALVGYWTIRTIKRRVTWPRTGYMVPRDVAKRRWAAFTGGAVAVATVFLIVRFHAVTSFPRLGLLALSLLLYAGLVFRIGREHPWKWGVLLFMAAGLGAIELMVPGGYAEIVRPMLWFVAFTWLASGLITLYLYIRRTHPPEPEER